MLQQKHIENFNHVPTLWLARFRPFSQGTPTSATTDAFRLGNHLSYIPTTFGKHTYKMEGMLSGMTTNEGEGKPPHFSPDGNWIAFYWRIRWAIWCVLDFLQRARTQAINLASGGNFGGQVWSLLTALKVIFSSGRKVMPRRNLNSFKFPWMVWYLPQAMAVPRAVKWRTSADGNNMAYQQISFWDPEMRKSPLAVSQADLDSRQERFHVCRWPHTPIMSAAYRSCGFGS